ncbi:MAG: CBS domain-containing protein [Chloroflexota bacterium]
MKQEMVKEWMTPEPVTITPNTTLPEAHRLMMEHSIRRLPVVQNGRLVGIVTLGDVRGAEPSGATSLSIWEINYLVSRLRVEEIMTPRPFTINDSATLGEAARLMLKYKVSGLPVLDDSGNLVGIITESDIFRMVVKNWQSAVEPTQ